MMLAINFWILTFHVVYLSGDWAIYGADSELAQAFQFMATFPEVRYRSRYSSIVETVSRST